MLRLERNTELIKFFSEEVSRVASSFPDLLSTPDEEELETKPATNNGMYNWLCMLKRVSDLTKLDFDNCWKLGIFEFFNYLAFDVSYRREEEKQLDQWRKSH